MGCGGSKYAERIEQESPPTPVKKLAPSGAHISKQTIAGFSVDDLVNGTRFTRDEVLSLHRLFDRLSNELHKDNLIHKDEFLWAIFHSKRDSLFAERVFESFDIKQNQVVDFEEFVRSLSVFHPDTPLEEKASFAFKIYDIGRTGAIERSELKRFLVATMAENPDVIFDEASLEAIVDATFAEADLAGDGRINPEEWVALVRRNPDIISFMSLPVLQELTTRFPPT